jgi:predicted  nucleic acid-binding Zn-ribbon protein
MNYQRQLPERLDPAESKMDNFKETSLKGHIQLCELRYKALEERLDNVELRIAKIETTINDLQVQTQAGFSEIKLLLERQNSSKQVQVIATFGTIITAILAFAGYLIVN